MSDAPIERAETTIAEYATSIIQSMADMLIVVSPEGTVLTVNNATCRHTGYSEAEIVGQPAASLFEGEEEEVLDATSCLNALPLKHPILRRLLREGFVRNIEKTLRRKDGGSISVLFSASVMRDNQQQVRGIVCLALDITERKAIERRLGEFSAVVEQTIDGIAIADLDGNLSFVNNSWKAMHGYHSQDELRGQHLGIFHTAEQLTTDVMPFKKVLIERGANTGEVGHKRKDGTTFPTWITATVLKDPKGQPYGLAGIAQDITERKQAEEALRESEQRFMDVLYRSEDAILLIGDNRFIACNEATARMLGYATRHEFLQTHPSELSPPQQPDGRSSFEKAEEMMRLASERGFRRFEWIHRRANGDDFPVEVSLTPIIHEGKPLIHCVWRDITEHKRAEETLRRESERLDHVLTITRTRIDIIDADFNLHFVSKGWQKVYGDPAGRKCHDYFRDSDAPCPGCGIPEALESRQVVVTEQTLPRENNRVVEAHSIPFQDDTGQWLVAEFKVDITDRKRREDDLRRAREQLSLAVEGSNDGIFDWDLRTQELYLSPRWKEQLGYADNELPNVFSTFEQLLCPEDKPEVLKYVTRYLKGEVPHYAVEFRMRHKDGDFRWILARGAALRNPDGTPYRMAGSHTDITERRRMEKARTDTMSVEIFLGRASGLLLSSKSIDKSINACLAEIGVFCGACRASLFQFISDGAFMTNTYEWCAPGVQPAIQGFQSLPVDAFPWWMERLRSGETIAVDDVESMPAEAAAEREILASRGIKSCLVVPITDGDFLVGFLGLGIVVETRTLCEHTLNALRLLAQLISSALSRKRAEESLEKSEERYRLLFDKSQDAMVTVAPPSWLFTSANAAALTLFGVDRPDEFLALGAWDISPERQPDGRSSTEKAQEMIETAMREGSVLFDWMHRRIDGQTFSATVLLTRMALDDQVFLQATVRDVSQQKALETELSHARKLEAVGQLAAGIAHEINTPTQFVSDSIHFLREACDNQQELIGQYRLLVDTIGRQSGHEELLAQIREAEEKADIDYFREHIPGSFERCFDGLERIGAIVGAMKDFAHPDQKEKVSADLNQAIQATLTIAKNECKYVADVETELGDLPPVVCHIGELNQVFLNLLVNAAHAIADALGDTGGRGKIRVRTRAEGEHVLVEIEDTGTGIPEKVRDRVFDPFFTTKEVGKGSGQGLAIARSIVTNKHGGTLTFRTQEGQGTTFIIRIPVDGKNSDMGRTR